MAERKVIECDAAPATVEVADASTDATDIAKQIADAFAFLGDTDSEAETEPPDDPLPEDPVEEPPLKRRRTEGGVELQTTEPLEVNLTMADEPLEVHLTMADDISTRTISVGLLPPEVDCSRCGRKRLAGVENAGVYCGRATDEGTCVGCGAAICWRCMKRAPHTELGSIRTSKEECEGLAQHAWWMHEFCMREEDKKDYYGSSDLAIEADDATVDSEAAPVEDSLAGAPQQGGAGDAATGRFAWE